MCISMWSHWISPDHGCGWLMTEAKVLQSQPGDVQGMVKCIWIICAAPREFSRKAGTAKEAARGNRLSLHSQKPWDSLLYYSHIVDKNQSRSTNALRENLSGNLLPVRTKANPSHHLPAPNPLDTSVSIPAVSRVTSKLECLQEHISSQQSNFKRHQQLLLFLLSQVGTSWTEKQIWMNRENWVGKEVVGEVLVGVYKQAFLRHHHQSPCRG